MVQRVSTVAFERIEARAVLTTHFCVYKYTQ